MRNDSTVSQKENWAPLQRRLSLKYSSAIQAKNNPRMSIPMRRQSITTSTGLSPFNDGSNFRPSFCSTASVQLQKGSTKKQAILTNLIHKLDHEEELKEIIHSKIRNGRKKDTISCFEGETSQFMESKLRQYQEEIECFKDLVRELVDKISTLEQNTTREYINKASRTIATQTNIEEPNFIKKEIQPQMDQSVDFMQNLNQTLKVLSGNKKTR